MRTSACVRAMDTTNKQVLQSATIHQHTNTSPPSFFLPGFPLSLPIGQPVCDVHCCLYPRISRDHLPCFVCLLHPPLSPSPPSGHSALSTRDEKCPTVQFVTLPPFPFRLGQLPAMLPHSACFSHLRRPSSIPYSGEHPHSTPYSY